MKAENTNIGPWNPVDPMGEILHLFRMGGVFYSRAEFTSPWGLELPPLDRCLMFHAITEGDCWLQVGGKEHRLRKGHLVLITRGEGHNLCDEIGAPMSKLFDLPRQEVSERYEILHHGGGGKATRMICGAVHFDHPASKYLINHLPPVICVDTVKNSEAAWLKNTLDLMAREATALRPGGDTLVTRLADVLVVLAIRSWIGSTGENTHGWLKAIQDPLIGKAILFVHRQPEKSWTVESLAHEVSMSRSAFADRFREVVGETPMQYLAQWRVSLAMGWLQESASTVAEVAGRVGYQSEASFSRAFKRIAGFPPGSLHKKKDSILDSMARQ